MKLKKFNPSQVSPQEWYSINRFILGLGTKNSPCVSVFYPHDKNAETLHLLQKTKRDNPIEKIESAIEKRIIQLSKGKKSKKQFAQTHCIFGWQSNGKVKLKEIEISKKLPYIYLVGKKPYVKPFYDILKTNYQIILVILDHKSAHLKHLQGDKVVSEKRLSINLQGRHKKGGQSQKRFLRARQTFIQGFFKKIEKKISDINSKDVEILFLGGVGTAKTKLYNVLSSELKSKCGFIDDITFSTPTNVVNKKIINHLYEYRKKHVLEVASKFQKLVKEGLVVKKNSDIQKALQIGAVDTLLVAANYYHLSPTRNKIIKMLELAENTSSSVEFVTNPKLVAGLGKHEHVLALLRYKFK